MSSGEVPRVPERPQRVKRPAGVTAEAGEGLPSPSPAVGVSSSDGSYSPRLPAHRPQRLRNNASLPVGPLTRPAVAKGEHSDQESSAPETRSDQATSDGSGAETDRSKYSKPSAEHEDVPAPPSRRPQRAKTTPLIPAMPATRPPVKARTAASMDEMDAPPKALNRDMRRSTTDNLDLLVQNTSEQLKEMELLLSKHDASGERGKTSREAGRGSDAGLAQKLASELDVCETTSQATPDLKIASEAKMKTLQAPPVGEVDLGVEDEEVTKEEQREERYYGQAADYQINKLPIRGSDSQTEPKQDISGEMEVAHPESPVITCSEETASSDPHKKEGLSVSTGDEAGADLLKQKEALKSTEDHTGSELRKKEKAPVSDEDLSPSDSSSKVKEKKETSTSAAEPTVSKPADAQPQKSIQQSVQSAKRGAPPVPKKPSSRIAAFQQMLQKQQLEQLQGAVPSRSRESSPPAEARAGKLGSSSRTALSEDRTQFGKNLGALFANPGMIPGGVPAAVKEKQDSLSPKEESLKSTDNTTSDVRQRRARGPRGRKLPTKVANFEQVKTEHGNNEIEIFHVWTIVPTKSNTNDIKEMPEGSSEQESVEPPGEAEALNITTGGLQERRPSVFDNTSESTGHLQQTLEERVDESLTRSLQGLAQDDAHQIVSGVREEPEALSETTKILDNEEQDVQVKGQGDRLEPDPQDA